MQVLPLGSASIERRVPRLAAARRDPRGANLREPSPPDAEAALTRLLDEARGGAGSEPDLVILGGEPTLCAELLPLVRRAQQAGRRVLLETNGRLLARAGLAEALREAGVCRLDVSLQGPSAASHDFHTQCPGSFRETVAGLRRARAAGLGVAVTTLVTRSNYRHLAELVQVAHVLGASALRLLPVAAPFVPGHTPNPALVAPYLRRAERAAAVLGLLVTGPSGAPRPAWFVPVSLGAAHAQPPLDAARAAR